MVNLVGGNLSGGCTGSFSSTDTVTISSNSTNKAFCFTAITPGVKTISAVFGAGAEVVVFSIAIEAATCSDGVMNQTETAVDTGGECTVVPINICPEGTVGIFPFCSPPPTDPECLEGFSINENLVCVPNEPVPICENGQNLLVNASFEEPVADANTHAGGLWEIFTTVLGWTISSNELEIWNGLFGGASAGMQNAELDGNQNTNISQIITTIPGATYELKFDFSARPDVVDNAITAKVAGVDIAAATADGVGLTTTSWETISNTFVATTTTTQVEFVDNGTSNSLGSLIDNTAVCFVSEPDVDPEPTATIVATKIVCADEADLPNWNTNGRAPVIDENTASDFLATKTNDQCWFEKGWEFEWAHEGAADPGDTATGTAGIDWNTFGSTDELGQATVSLDEDTLDGDSYLWVREILQDGYIPFTHDVTPDNSNNVTAEMYCHKDGLNYDNLDRIDDVSVGNTYHCVAFNAEVTEAVPMCEIELVSSISTVFDTFETAVETYDNHPSWSANIEDATWIWSDEYVVDANVEEMHIFTETFTVTTPSSALLDVAADNTYKVYVNGILVLDRMDPILYENNFARHTQKSDVDILPFLIAGENELKIEVTNLAQPGGNAISNPAGLLFRLDVVGESGCLVTTEPKPPLPPIDVCPNIPDLQTSIPEGFEKVGDSNDCTQIPEITIDVCPNIPDLQTSIPEGFEKVGDSNDCSAIEPTIIPEDTTNERSSGSGGGRGRITRTAPTGAVLGASTMQCGLYLFDYLKQGGENDVWEVKKLQWFLIGQGYSITATGDFDQATEEAVKAFQLKYQSDILTPWMAAGIVPSQNPTGWVYQLTRWKINNIVCPGSEAMPVLIP